MRKIPLFIISFVLLSSSAWAADKDVTWVLPGDMGEVSFYGQDRFRWYAWDYFESEPFDDQYDHFGNQLRLGSRLDNSILKAHAAWQYATVWNLPTGAGAGAGSGPTYFFNG